MIGRLLILLAAFVGIVGPVARAVAADGRPLRVGSKKFTESVILGEIVARLARQGGVDVRHRAELGGSRLLFEALAQGELDVYPEYTGTLRLEILSNQSIESREQLRQALAERGLRMSPPLGFNNSYGIGMRDTLAEKLNVRTLTDLRDHPELRLGFSNEFMDRADGWPGLRTHYQLPQRRVRGLDHDLAYRALAAGDIQATDVYTTDAEIEYHDLRVLEDDRSFFPAYEAVLLYRAELEETEPEAVAAFERLAGAIDEAAMRSMNGRVKLDGLSEPATAAAFLNRRFGIQSTIEASTLGTRIAARTAEHLGMVAVSLAAAILFAVPLGILAAKQPRLGQLILAVAAILLTIPALALLVFMLPLFGIGYPPAVAALFLYSLLPIVRNTYAGLRNIPARIAESAEALGLSAARRLWHIELPMAAPSILAGIKTAAVLNVGFATLGALIGADGYGQPILAGIRLNSYARILEGAVPAALLAILTHLLFDALEWGIVPRGLRARRAA